MSAIEHEFRSLQGVRLEASAPLRAAMAHHDRVDRAAVAKLEDELLQRLGAADHELGRASALDPEAAGVSLVDMDSDGLSVIIIGVVRDFHYDSMHDEIQPKGE